MFCRVSMMFHAVYLRLRRKALNKKGDICRNAVIQEQGVSPGNRFVRVSSICVTVNSTAHIESGIYFYNSDTGSRV